MAKTNSNSIDFTATIKATELAAIIVPEGKQLSPEREQLKDRYDDLTVKEALWYKVEDGKDAKETKDSIGPFLARQDRPAKVSLAKNVTDYVVIERIAPKK